LEGVYDPENGRMHLIGCRDVGLRWPNLSANGDIEEGMDCSIEVRVDYPPTNTQWFIWSTAKVRVASTRDASDPLHFHTMKLQAIPIKYPTPRPDDLNRGIVNGVLGIVLLSASIAAALSQLRHLKAHADVAPYVSLVMVCVQALGFGMPLITGIEALVAKATIRSDTTAMPPSSSSPSYALIVDQLYRSIDQAVKVLSLAAFVVTLRLGQKVHRSRARMLARSPLEPGRVPGDAKVLTYHYAVHLGLFVLILALNGQAITVEQHVALLQDLFLLPQVIGNAMWRINCRPLVESYYLGVTAVRLLSHLYELVRPPPSVVYSHEYLNARRAVFSIAWDVAVPVGAVLLGIVVYVQQRWNYAIVSRMGMTEQRKLQHIF
jgi:hypothetical protein